MVPFRAHVIVRPDWSRWMVFAPAFNVVKASIRAKITLYMIAIMVKICVVKVVMPKAENVMKALVLQMKPIAKKLQSVNGCLIQKSAQIVAVVNKKQKNWDVLKIQKAYTLAIVTDNIAEQNVMRTEPLVNMACASRKRATTLTESVGRLHISALAIMAMGA